MLEDGLFTKRLVAEGVRGLVCGRDGVLKLDPGVSEYYEGSEEIATKDELTSLIFASNFFILCTLALSSSIPRIASTRSLRYAPNPKPVLPACPLMTADSLSRSAVTPDR